MLIEKVVLTVWYFIGVSLVLRAKIILSRDQDNGLFLLLGFASKFLTD
jgi:hypothetical protein